MVEQDVLGPLFPNKPTDSAIHGKILFVRNLETNWQASAHQENAKPDWPKLVERYGTPSRQSLSLWCNTKWSVRNPLATSLTQGRKADSSYILHSRELPKILATVLPVMELRQVQQSLVTQWRMEIVALAGRHHRSLPLFSKVSRCEIPALNFTVGKERVDTCVQYSNFAGATQRTGILQIGRASCRERVWRASPRISGQADW